MTNKEYNGWTNYETWACNLHFDDFFTEQAQEIWDSLEGSDDRKSEATDRLAEYIEETVTGEDFAPKVEGFYADLLNASFREINFSEIAQHYIDDTEG